MGTKNPAGQDITELADEHQAVHLHSAHPSYGLPPNLRMRGGADRHAPVDHVEGARRVRQAAALGYVESNGPVEET